MIRDIITYPDKRLWQKSSDIKEFNKELHTLLDDMYETMIDKQGIGLAAIQIAVPLNVLVINLVNEESGKQEKDELLEVINPKIVEKKGKIIYQEGCLSVPGFYEDVERFEEICVSFYDRFGNKIKKDFSGLFAIAMQHEMDHLAGHLFIEKISYTKRKKFEKEYKKSLKSR